MGEERVHMAKDFGDVTVRKSNLEEPQFEDRLGAFANRDFKKGEVVIKWKLKTLTKDQYEKLPERERRQFTHKRGDLIYFYPDPERHVNRSEKNYNLVPDFDLNADVALRDIKEGEELTISAEVVEDSV
jgi:hypothetical protein